MRSAFEDDHGLIALLSFSNIAVETFRAGYHDLMRAEGGHSRYMAVEIDTVDAFITCNVLRPHGHRTMNASRTPFLVEGGAIGDFVFLSRTDYLGHLSIRQYACLVDERVSTIGVDKREYGTHSMRRTKASLIYKATGNLRAVQILLGHTNIENTVRYLGVDFDDALTLSERTEI